jgi:hypothetical protein
MEINQTILPVASHILMIRPAAFGYNAETATNNYFQSLPEIDKTAQQQLAAAEFDAMVAKLREHGIAVTVLEDSAQPPKPDAIFPNNWLSTAPDGKLFVYPMFAPVRRAEKSDAVLDYLSAHFHVTAMQDWSEFETEGKFLEGTGSMIMDHDNKLIYACISERSNPAVLEKFAAANGYQAIVFLATDKEGNPVYHTNVVMMLGHNFCVLCEEAIEEEWELIAVRQLLESTGHTILPITRHQMYSYAGNMLEVQNNAGENILVMSQAAYNSLTQEQQQKLSGFAKLLTVSIPTIEQAGGGSVRCMMAEVFLESKY